MLINNSLKNIYSQLTPSQKRKRLDLENIRGVYDRYMYYLDTQLNDIKNRIINLDLKDPKYKELNDEYRRIEEERDTISHEFEERELELKRQEGLNDIYMGKEIWELTSDQYIASLTANRIRYNEDLINMELEKYDEFKQEEKDKGRGSGFIFGNKLVDIFNNGWEIKYIDKIKTLNKKDILFYSCSNKDGEVYIVGCDKGIIIGFMQLIKQDNNKYYVWDIEVSDLYKGMKIGEKLYEIMHRIYPNTFTEALTPSSYKQRKKLHKKIVYQAIAEGKPVPQKVLREYGLYGKR